MPSDLLADLAERTTLPAVAKARHGISRAGIRKLAAYLGMAGLSATSWYLALLAAWAVF